MSIRADNALRAEWVLDSSGKIDTHIEFTEQICPKHSIKCFPTQQLRHVETLTCTPSNFSQNSAQSTTVATRGLICFHVSGALCTCWLLQERVCNRRMGISGGFHGLAAVVSLWTSSMPVPNVKLQSNDDSKLRGNNGEFR
jgi:hypothetical protein